MMKSQIFDIHHLSVSSKNKGWRANKQKEIVNMCVGWLSDGARLCSFKYVKIMKMKDKN